MEVQDSPEDVPSRVIFELTKNCDYRCRHCFLEEYSTYGPSTEEAVEIAEKAIESGVPSISWTGGETYLRDDLFEIMERIENSEEIVHTVNTNGSLIDEEKAERTSDYFSLARVSVFGDRSTYQENTQQERWGYEDSLNAVDLFLDEDVPVQVNVPAIDSPYTLKSLTEKLEERYGSDLEEVTYIPVISLNNEAGNYPSREEIIDEIGPIEENISFPIRFFEWAPGKHMVIKADKHAYAHPVSDSPNGSIKIGNVLENSIKDLWADFPKEFIEPHRNLTPDVSHLGE